MACTTGLVELMLKVSYLLTPWLLLMVSCLPWVLLGPGTPQLLQLRSCHMLLVKVEFALLQQMFET